MVEGWASAEDPLAPYDFELPPKSIAQEPTPERDGARLMVLPKSTTPETAREPIDSHIHQLPRWLESGDLLVCNATQVLCARLRGHKTTGGAVETLLLGPMPPGADPAADPRRFRALLKQTGKLRVGTQLIFGTTAAERPGHPPLPAEVTRLFERGEVELHFAPGPSPYELGEIPLPPYIDRRLATASQRTRDKDRYQTVFARVPGAIAAPTAGLHLSHRLLSAVREAGIEVAEVVLHVGAGTFRPLDARALSSGRLHAERFELPEATARAIAATRERGGRVVAVGTTTTRVLESCATSGGRVSARSGETELFLRPGDSFSVVDALLTNFHLPRSSLLLLVAAFAGRERVMAAYAEAIGRGYRFYSYGDAMLLVGTGSPGPAR